MLFEIVVGRQFRRIKPEASRLLVEAPAGSPVVFEPVVFEIVAKPAGFLQWVANAVAYGSVC